MLLASEHKIKIHYVNIGKKNKNITIKIHFSFHTYIFSVILLKFTMAKEGLINEYIISHWNIA